MLQTAPAINSKSLRSGIISPEVAVACRQQSVRGAFFYQIDITIHAFELNAIEPIKAVITCQPKVAVRRLCYVIYASRCPLCMPPSFVMILPNFAIWVESNGWPSQYGQN